MASLTVRIPDSLEAELEAASRACGLSKSDLAREAIERHLRLRTLREVREGLSPYLDAQGVLTEADVLKRLGKAS